MSGLTGLTATVASLKASASSARLISKSADDDNDETELARVRNVIISEQMNPKISSLKHDPSLMSSAVMKSIEFGHMLNSGVVGRRGSETEGALNLKTVFEAKKLGTKARRKVQNITEGHCRVRTVTGTVSYGGYDRLKARSKKDPIGGKANKMGHFTPQHQPFRPIGGDMAMLKRKKKLEPDPIEDFFEAKKLRNLTDLERMQQGDPVPLNAREGFPIDLDSHDERLLRIRPADSDETLTGRDATPRSLIVQISNIRGGTPDLMMTPDRLVEVWGIPRKEKCVWRTKDVLVVTPDDKNYTKGTYYVRITTGIEASAFNLVVVLAR